MEIGKIEEVIVVEPIETPVPGKEQEAPPPEPSYEPEPEPVREPEPALVPAA